MYLVSLYFDEKTERYFNSLIRQTAKVCGNSFMIDGKVPPHITISAFESRREEEVLEKLDKALTDRENFMLQWVSAGQFFPGTMFVSAVLNPKLHELSEIIHDAVREIPDLTFSRYYQPFQWIPHTTIAKTLTEEEMKRAFSVLQGQFGPLRGRVIRIGLAKTNPYRDLNVWNLL